MNSPLYEVQRFLQENRILISFTGKLTQGLIEEYGAAVRKYLENAERPTNEVRSIFSIFIEQTQNINNYCSGREHSPWAEQLARSSIVTIGEDSLGHYIYSGNLMETADVEPLKHTLDELLKLDKDGLKQLYKARLREAVEPGSLGAGIGLIDMARKAKQPLEYSFTPIEGGLTFFTLKAVV
ncbi:SiaB family protein kinase [Paenibacillus sp. YYML68]|uniref:SiaB family protein kinase n=1 Tax=Paenibacillus sp. YYML68 TaxID=2909250 RepID=UPI0024937EC6|nr:SiaB family protein kinase [Paenibacillus sp. YYML68]